MWSLPFSALLSAGLLVAAEFQAAGDPTVRAAVERYYRMLEAEDVDGYLALWSAAAQRPQRESLKYLFDAADERYTDIQILRAVSVGDRLRVRLSLHRERTAPPRVRGGSPLVTSRTGRPRSPS